MGEVMASVKTQNRRKLQKVAGNCGRLRETAGDYGRSRETAQDIGDCMIDHINKYYQSVYEAYRIGNIESSYNAPIMVLLTQFGCIPRDMSGERSGKTGENIDIKLWRGDEDIAETEPFAGVEIKKVGGIDTRALKNIKMEATRYGSAILTDNLVWQFWRSGEDKMYTGVHLIERNGNKLALKQDNIELFVSLIKDFLLRNPAHIRSSDKLAEYMAMHARTIRSVITGVLKDDSGGQPLVNDRQKSLPMFPELFGLFSRIKQDLLLNNDSNKIIASGDESIISSASDTIMNCDMSNNNPNAFYVSEDMFHTYAAAGARLRKLHLMQTKVYSKLIIEPNTSEDMQIGAIKYRGGILHLNANKRILGISADVWNYRIGGYQVLDKWFKSHRGETLTIDSFEHIANVAGLLAETIKIQEDLRGLHTQVATRESDDLL